jgi:hypothetical protein
MFLVPLEGEVNFPIVPRFRKSRIRQFPCEWQNYRNMKRYGCKANMVPRFDNPLIGANSLSKFAGTSLVNGPFDRWRHRVLLFRASFPSFPYPPTLHWFYQFAKGL